MAVTEIALLRFTAQSPSPATKKTLYQVKKAQSEWSGYPVHFALQVEDPSLLYLFGGWNFVTTHMGEWIPSETNQTLLEQLKGDMDVEWMFHLQIDPAVSKISFNAPVIAINRYFVDSSGKAAFDEGFKTGSFYHTAPFMYTGGWRVDKEGNDEEFVIFSQWDSVEDHLDFEKKGFKGFKDLIKRIEIKHAYLEKF